MGIPELRKNGLLPRGLHQATSEELRAAFGKGSPKRVALTDLVEEAIERAWRTDVERILVNGSYVTAKEEPGDVDMVLQISDRFAKHFLRGSEDAIWIEGRFQEASPRFLDLHYANDPEEWASWIRLFEKQSGKGKKGLVEVIR